MLKPLLNVDFEFIPIYFVMMLLGFFAAYKKLSVLLEQNGYSLFTSKKLKLAFFWSAVAGLLGANISNWFLFEGLMELPLYVRLTKGGFSFIFGLITFLIVSAILLKLKNANVKEVLNLSVEPILIAHFFGRLGCSLQGCCWGRSIIIIGREIMFPAREIEAIFLLVMFIVIPRISKKKTLWAYLFSYSIFRFIIEFFRGDDRGCLLGIEILSPSQVVCLILFILSTITLFFRSFLVLLKKEKTYDEWYEKYVKNKIRCIGNFSKKVQPGDKSLLLSKITKGFVISIIVVILIIVVNPLKLSWCQELCWKINKGCSSIAAKTSKSEEIGDGSGTEIIGISYNEVVNLKSGLAIINEIDDWTDAEFAPLREETLENGSKIYQYVQVVDERPVLGNVRILVTDSSSCPQYIINDVASQAFTTKYLDNYIVNGSSLEEVLSGGYDITDSLLCWYDSGYGLVAARHVLLSNNGQDAVGGAVLQESDNKIICFTGPYLGILSNAQNDSSFFENQIISSGGKLIRNNSSDMTIAEFIDWIIEKYEIDDKRASEIILSTNQIAKKVSSLNVKLYCTIFETQVQSVLQDEGYPEEKVKEICNEIQKYLQGLVDEHTIKILPEKRENTFTYELNYEQDVDIINIENQYAQTIELVLESEKPVQVEIYSKDGNPLNVVYIQDEENIILYPEDGRSFLLRVSNGALHSQNYENQYSITVRYEEENTKVPLKISTILYRIERAYNKSDIFQFMTMYSTDEYSMEEGLISALLVPFIDSCECQNDIAEETDLAKEIIASILLDNYIDLDLINWLQGSQMKVSYADHIELDNGYFVKANVFIEKDGIEIYNGFTRFELVKNEKNQESQKSSTNSFLEKIFKHGLFITTVNTEELFTAFGEDINNPNIKSDLKSLYEFCEDYIVSEYGVDVHIQKFDKQAALLNGHSEKKVSKFQEYIDRTNQSRYIQIKEEIEQKIDLYTSIIMVDDVSSFISNPMQFLIEKGIDICNSKSVSDAYLFIKMEFDSAGVMEDVTWGKVIDELEKKVDELEKTVAKLGMAINQK